MSILQEHMLLYKKCISSIYAFGNGVPFNRNKWVQRDNWARKVIHELLNPIFHRKTKYSNEFSIALGMLLKDVEPDKIESVKEEFRRTFDVLEDEVATTFRGKINANKTKKVGRNKLISEDFLKPFLEEVMKEAGEEILTKKETTYRVMDKVESKTLDELQLKKYPSYTSYYRALGFRKD